MSDATYEGKMPTIDDFYDPEPIEQKEMFPGFPCFLFTPEELKQAKSREMLPYMCSHCGKTFFLTKNTAQAYIKRNWTKKYCSSECCNQHRSELHKKEAKEYCCEMCGKHVPASQTYGEGRFCSISCSKRYASTCKDRQAINKKVSIKLKEYYKTHPGTNLGKSHQKSQETINNILKTIDENKDVWNLADILQINFSDPYYRRFALKAIKECHLVDNPKFFPSKWPMFIEMCRNILQKPIEQGSLTYDDISKVSDYFNKCIWEDRMTCNEIIRMHIQCDKRSLHLKENLPKVKFRTIGEDFALINQRLRADDWTSYIDHPIPKRKYDKLCAFRFKEDLYPFIKGYELYCQLGMYICKKTKIGVERDHRISKAYGWKHNIDPAIISHPANCEFLPYNENRRKLEKCSITLEQLMEEIKAFDERLLSASGAGRS